METIVVILIAVIIIILIKNKKDKQKFQSNINVPTIEVQQPTAEETPEEKIPYRRKYLLTKNELYFYKQLKPIATEYGYTIISKIRLADLIEVNNEINDNEKLKYFNKIASKHIDFALCNPDNLYIEYLIELDDNSHNGQKRKERDIFIEKVIEKSGYKLIRTLSAEQLKDKIINKKESRADE